MGALQATNWTIQGGEGIAGLLQVRGGAGFCFGGTTSLFIRVTSSFFIRVHEYFDMVSGGGTKHIKSVLDDITELNAPCDERGGITKSATS